MEVQSSGSSASVLSSSSLDLKKDLKATVGPSTVFAKVFGGKIDIKIKGEVHSVKKKDLHQALERGFSSSEIAKATPEALQQMVSTLDVSYDLLNSINVYLEKTKDLEDLCYARAANVTEPLRNTLLELGNEVASLQYDLEGARREHTLYVPKEGQSPSAGRLYTVGDEQGLHTELEAFKTKLHSLVDQARQLGVPIDS